MNRFFCIFFLVNNCIYKQEKAKSEAHTIYSLEKGLENIKISS